MHLDRLKIIICVLAMAGVIKIAMNNMGFVKWCVGNRFVLTQIGTTVVYFAIVLLLLFGYLKSSLRRRWKHIILIAVSPVIFFFAFCVVVIGPVYIISAVLALLFTLVDLWGQHTGADSRLVYCFKQRRSFHYKRGWDIICKNIGIGMVILGLSSIGVFANMYAKDCVRIVPGKGEEELTYATNVRDLLSTASEDLWEDNKDVLVNLSDQVFPYLDMEHKLLAYQSLLDIETSYLGIEHIQLAMKESSDDSVAGYFSSENQLIALDEKYVNCNSSYDGIGIILHEAHHFYAHQCCENLQKMKDAGVDMDLLFARDIEQWEFDQNNYYTVEDNTNPDEYYRYASQALETAADEYKSRWQGAYWEFINNIEFKKQMPAME